VDAGGKAAGNQWPTRNDTTDCDEQLRRPARYTPRHRSAAAYESAVEEIMGEEEAWNAEHEVARIDAEQPPAQLLRSGSYRRCPVGELPRPHTAGAYRQANPVSRSGGESLSATLKALKPILKASPAVNSPSRAHSVGPWGFFSAIASGRAFGRRAPNRGFRDGFRSTRQVVKKSGLVPFKIQGLEPNGDVHDVLGNLRSKSRVTWRSAKEQICSPQSTKNVRLVCPASQPSGSIRPIRHTGTE
jgi:hypothetical protein